ncbi:MAG: NAD-dependent epimerase/dehydratase family protein [Candidatus Falkowbacteria bacterium]|nr:NAD-dependent epimerase/dehydratase family protein [Candidatus Falkowbacteria bacterium]
MKLNDGQMIPDFVQNALDNKDLVVIGDENFHTSICYVQDVVDAAIKFMETDIDTPINIGSDVDINITELAQKIINLIGSTSKITYSSSLLFVTELPLPDMAKAARDLSWIPIVTLENGLKKTIHDLMASKGLREII